MEEPGNYLPELDTPAVLIDLEIMEANLASMASIAAGGGKQLRPHAKSHKSPHLAWQQIHAGAVGITCQKLAEAEVMARAGIKDILVVTPVVGEIKLLRFFGLLRQARLTAVVDSLAQAEPLDRMARERGEIVDILVEVDVGYHRGGIEAREAAAFASRLAQSCENLRVEGVMAYEGHLYDLRDAGAVASEARRTYDQLGLIGEALERLGVPSPRVSVGASTAARVAAKHKAVTEIRAGSYLFNDLSQIAMGSATEAQCALSVLTTVVSVPTADRAITDAGAKALTYAPLSGFPGYGRMITHSDSVIARLADEHGIVSVPPGARPFHVGERVRIIPNSHTVVVNEFSEMAGVRRGTVEWRRPIAARGCVQ